MQQTVRRFRSNVLTLIWRAGCLLTIGTQLGYADIHIEEVIVTAPNRERRALQPTIEFDQAQIEERAPVALTDIFKGMPSVGIRTNSRGEAEATLTLDWLIAQHWDRFLEVRHVGTALDEDEGGSVRELPTSTAVSFRLFRTVRQHEAGRWRLYAGVDNVGDELILPQLGLPQPGRMAMLGVALEWL